MESEIRLQQSIDEISPETLSDALTLSVSDIVSTEQVITNILIASHIRPTKLNLLSELCRMIDESEKKGDFKPKMLRVFMKQVFRDPLKHGKEIINIEFYHTLFTSSFISRELIESELELVLCRFNNHIEVLGSFFLWFSEEFRDHQLFIRYKNDFVTKTKDSFLNYEYTLKYDISGLFEYYPPMQTAAFYPITWKFIQSNYNYNENYMIEEIIMRDDVDSLQQLANNKGFDFNQVLVSAKSHPFLQFSPTLIQVAAFYRAINCFKFLILNGSSIKEHDLNNIKTIRERGPGVMRFKAPKIRLLNTSYAVAGGSIEIIRIMEQQNLKFERAEVNIALYFHHYDVFQWLIDTKGLTITTQCMYFSATTNNLSFFCNNDCDNLIDTKYKVIKEIDDGSEEFPDDYFSQDRTINMRLTAKHVVIKNGFLSIVKKLNIVPEEVLYSYHQEKFTNSFEKRDPKKSALALALKYKQRMIINHFLPIIKDKEEIFYWAVYRNELDLVKILINEYRYPVNMIIKGFRATEIAKLLQHTEMEAFLRSCGGIIKPSHKKRTPIDINKKKVFYVFNENNKSKKSSYNYVKISLEEKVSSFIENIRRRVEVSKAMFEGKRLDPNEKLSFYKIRGGSVITIAEGFRLYA